MKNFKEKLLAGEFLSKVNECISGEQLNSPEVLHKIIAPMISYNDDREHFFTLFLDVKNRILKIDQSFMGSLSSCNVYPREIMKIALKEKASSLIFVHNHPSGDLEFSPSDVKITKKLWVAAISHDIVVHDHLVINGSTYNSMNELGLLTSIKNAWDNFIATNY